MKKFVIFLFILLFPAVIFAQGIRPLKAQSVRKRSTWTTIADSASSNFDFYFGGTTGKDRQPYSGFVSVVVWTDTSATAMPDSITASAHPMFYNAVNDAWEVAGGKLDSLDIKDNFNPITNHSDTVYSFALALNILGADGLRITVYNNDSARAIKVRVELRMAEG